MCGFVALVNSHRPPKRDPLPLVNQPCLPLEVAPLRCRIRQPTSLRDNASKNWRTGRSPPCGCQCRDGQSNPLRQESSPTRKATQDRSSVGSADDRRRHRGFGFPRIDDDDGRILRILHNALPHDRMRDARVRSDKDQHIRLFRNLRRYTEAHRIRMTAYKQHAKSPCIVGCCCRSVKGPCQT